MKLSNLLISAYVFLQFLPVRVFAASDAASEINFAQNELCKLDYSLGGQNKEGVCALPADKAIFNAIDGIIGYLPFYLTGLAFFAFLYSGGMYIFALGDSNKQEAAKKNMTWALTGMIVLVLIGAIIRFALFISTRTDLLTNTEGIKGITQ